MAEKHYDLDSPQGQIPNDENLIKYAIQQMMWHLKQAEIYEGLIEDNLNRAAQWRMLLQEVVRGTAGLDKDTIKEIEEIAAKAWGDDVNTCEWWVYSTALITGQLMVKCAKCGSLGTVDDPSKQEWSDAFHAPSQPYKWHDTNRVTIYQGEGCKE